MKTRVFVQRPSPEGTGNTPAEAPKYPLGGMDLVRTPASGAGDGGSTPSHPTSTHFCALGYCIYEPQDCPWGDGGCARMAHDDGEVPTLPLTDGDGAFDGTPGHA